jgi:quinoprotein glucose dehydrogenase
MHRSALVVLALSLYTILTLSAADQPTKPYVANVRPASDEALRAMKRIRVPEGMKLDLWAAEPLIANPVSFSIDAKNRIYVAETFRLHAGVTDIRGIMSWLDDDLACRTVEDRIAMMKRRLGKRAANYAVHHDRIRLLEDTTGSGKADRSTVFADGFHHLEDGIGAGVLARGKDVWYTCIPDLWLLRDTKGAGKADERRKLSTGYGVHIGFIGHDLHGLILGPDGKLYFSIGDRGFNVKTKDRHLFNPDSGAVLRCNPDGSDLEVFAKGLRNPQELAFDDHGNLFTCDNNSDGGDRVRWTYVVEGGDCGWRIGYQFGGVQGNRGPWNAEKMWYPQHPGQATWIVPPIANIADGPSGLTYYPGLGLSPRYNGHFFFADFRGGPGQSGIRSLANKPKGAGFTMIDQHEFLWSVLATDVDFGMDGALYVSDWVDGWGLTGKGRLWKLRDPKYGDTPAVREVAKLMAEGMEHRKPAELEKLLAHADMRIRKEAQFALAQGGKASIEVLARSAKQGRPLVARLHAIWGLGQIGRTVPEAYEPVVRLLEDSDPEVRAQATKVVGDGKVTQALTRLLTLLQDRDPRVQFFAAGALGKLAKKEAVTPLLALVRRNADRDPWLRYAAVGALAACADGKSLAEAATDAAVAVRRAALLAYRRQQSPEVARFLHDIDGELVLEAARAINDVPIETALAPLAALIGRRDMDEALGYRVLNANFRLGTVENARTIARFAARSDVKPELRVEALRELAMWDKPPGRDRVMGVWRPLPSRDRSMAADALRPALGGIFSGPDKVRQEAARVAAKLGIKEIGPALFDLVADMKRPVEVRVETLRALMALKDERLEKAVKLALADSEPRLRAEGRRVLAKTSPEAALPALARVLQEGATVEKQLAFEVLGEMKGSVEAVHLLDRWLDNLLAGKVAVEARLDLVEAAERQNTAALRKKLDRYESARAKGESFGKWRDSMAGGDPEAGRRIFLYKTEVSCLRCHKAAGEGVGEVGPDLTGIGSKQKRGYLLESIVEPNKQIAKGFETVELTLSSGQIRSGVLKSEDAKEVRLMTPEGALIVVPKSKIEERRSGKSAMPEDLIKHLSRKEVRDLVEFLASLKEAPKK